MALRRRPSKPRAHFGVATSSALIWVVVYSGSRTFLCRLVRFRLKPSIHAGLRPTLPLPRARRTEATAAAGGYMASHPSLPDAMPAFALRFVGREALPPRLSEFDLSSSSRCSDDGRHPGVVPQRPPAARVDAASCVGGRPTAGRLQRAASKPSYVRQPRRWRYPHRPSPACARSTFAPADTFQAPALGQDLPRLARTGADDEAAPDGHAVGTGC